MNTLFGMSVLTSSLVTPVPVIQMSADFDACTESCKNDMNKWLLETFGAKEVMYIVGKNTLVFNQSTLAKMKRELIKERPFIFNNFMYP